MAEYGKFYTKADGIAYYQAQDNTEVSLAPPAAAATDEIIDLDSNTSVNVETNSDENKIRFKTAGSERMIIDAAGLVGIGQTTPTAALDITTPSTTVTSLYIKRLSSQTSDLIRTETESGAALGIKIENDGDVTMGNSFQANVSKVNVFSSMSTGGDAKYNMYVGTTSSYGQGFGGGIAFGGRYLSSGTISTQFGAIWGEKETSSSGNFQGTVHIGSRTGSSNTITEGFVMTSAQLVGIGTASPGARLDVSQKDTSGATPVLELEQLDIDDTFVNIVGTSASDGTRSISSDTTEDAAKFGAFRVEINGTTKWVRVYDSES